ncbi:MAG: extracellular solute-binding protein [Acidimicrobiales bacterium]|nr:extracellular solute-binding protein [Acidimicrobiales bacterium]
MHRPESARPAPTHPQPSRTGQRPAPRRRSVVVLAAALAIALVASSCNGNGGQNADDALGITADCAIVVPMAVSPEKIDLLTDLAKTFNGRDVQVNGAKACVSPKSKSSGGSMQLLADGWRDEKAEGPQPVVWSPAGSGWGAVLDQRLTDAGQAPIAGQGQSFMNTPLVIAMPKPMAEALGWPQADLGWSDILAAVDDPQGWATYGHPEWGPFRLGKTNPNFSTSGLNALIAQNYAAAGKTRDLTLEDLDRPEVVEDNRTIESAVVHYGDTTLTFLNNLYRADQRNTALQYASAVAVEEKSIIDYNSGNPDGVLDPGEEPRPPRIPLVAIYPKEGTLFSDNPLYILDAPWVSADERAAAEQFISFVLEADNQQRVLQYNFRPGNAQVAISDPITTENYVDPDQPQTLLDVPAPEVMLGLLDKWNVQRKSARVLLVLDISGSMGEPATANAPETKLDLAQQAAIDSLDQFADADDVGLRVFSNGLGPDQTRNWLDEVPIEPIGTNREQMRNAIRGLFPTNGTPLYDTISASFQELVDTYDPTRINAVVLLTDGRNEDGDKSDDRAQLNALLTQLETQSQGESATPVRLFTIAYGEDADLTVLKQLADATNGAAYNASDPKSIAKVFTAVISNF